MKKNILQILAVFSSALFLFSACNYLDVVPVEQAGLDDTMTDDDDAINFVYTCYNAYRARDVDKFFEAGLYTNSTDETVSTPQKNEMGAKEARNQINGTNAPGTWTSLYNSIGQCNLFLATVDDQDILGATREKIDLWKKEVRLVRASFLFRLLETYGPIPIIDERMPMDITSDNIPGRCNYDYCVDYLVKEFDESAASGLPPIWRGDDWGRLSATAAKALKSILLLEAASPLWNGDFPYPEWKNTYLSGRADNDERYGYELVSHSYDALKWKRALEASLDALQYAESSGERELFDTEAAMKLLDTKNMKLSDIYIPCLGNDAASEEFKKRVVTMRILPNSYEDDGNHETIFGHYAQGANDRRNASEFPIRIVYSKNLWQHGSANDCPTLNAVQQFYTAEGLPITMDEDFPVESQWYERAGIKETNRKDIIKLHVDREPRFYAWIAYDGGDYAPKMYGGKPLIMNFKDGSGSNTTSNMPGNGWSMNYSSDYSPTGYLTNKFCQIDQQNSTTGNSTAGNARNYPWPDIRLAELYLNVAECYAALGEEDNSIKYLNPIRKRAGIPELTKEIVAKSGMSIMEWVRRERFIEFFGEGKRFIDARRWMVASDVFKGGSRTGLTPYVDNSSPSFEQFNTPRILSDQQFQWETRQYLMPIPNSEIYSAKKLVQAPGY